MPTAFSGVGAALCGVSAAGGGVSKPAQVGSLPGRRGVRAELCLGFDTAAALAASPAARGCWIDDRGGGPGWSAFTVLQPRPVGSLVHYQQQPVELLRSSSGSRPDAQVPQRRRAGSFGAPRSAGAVRSNARVEPTKPDSLAGSDSASPFSDQVICSGRRTASLPPPLALDHVSRLP